MESGQYGKVTSVLIMNEYLIFIAMVGSVLVGVWAVDLLVWLHDFDRANENVIRDLDKWKQLARRIEVPAINERPVYPLLTEEGDEVPVGVRTNPPVRIPNPRKVTPGECWK